MGRVDWTVFHWLNGPAGHHEWLDRLGKAAATRLVVVIVATLVLGWVVTVAAHLWRDRSLPRGLLAVVLTSGVALALALGANQLIGHLWFRARPYASHRGAHLIVSASGDPSFPSDHATAGFALSLSTLAELPRVAVLLFIETVLMSAGRVYVGLHYPGDILAGLLVSGAVVVAVSLIAGLAAGPIDRGASMVNGWAERRRWPVRLS